MTLTCVPLNHCTCPSYCPNSQYLLLPTPKLYPPTPQSLGHMTIFIHFSILSSGNNTDCPNTAQLFSQQLRDSSLCTPKAYTFITPFAACLYFRGVRISIFKMHPR